MQKAIVSTLIIFTTATATTLKVPSQYSTIQAAINATTTGDTVLVAAGTYAEHLTITDNNLTILSESGTGSTIIDGGATGRPVSITGTSAITLKGFSIKNGLASNGGGIMVSSSGTVLLDDLHIRNNVSSYNGGGVYTERYENAVVTINACRVYQNETVRYGGGIYNDSDNIIVQNCLIDSNTTQTDGGGIYTEGKIKLINSTLVNNTVTAGRYGAAMVISTGLDSVLLMNNLFYNNFGHQSYSADDGIHFWNGKFVAFNNYFCWQDTEILLSRGIGNIFSDSNPFYGFSNNDFRLPDTSSLIGAGINSITFDGGTYNAPSTDIEGNPRPNPAGSNPDMGAYENPLSMLPPEPFELVFPQNSDTIKITKGNKWSDTLSFAWQQPANYAAEALSYSLNLTGDLTQIVMPPPKLNMTQLALNHVEYYMHNAGMEIISGTWNITASNGESSTLSSNGPFTLTIDGSAVNIDEFESLPETFALHANYPNPFNPTTTISYDLPKRSQVTLGIYDLLGKQIKTLVNQSQDVGNKIAVWDGTDNLGRQVSAGVYLYQIQAGEFTQTRKMLLLK